MRRDSLDQWQKLWDLRAYHLCSDYFWRPVRMADPMSWAWRISLRHCNSPHVTGMWCSWVDSKPRIQSSTWRRIQSSGSAPWGSARWCTREIGWWCPRGWWRYWYRSDPTWLCEGRFCRLLKGPWRHPRCIGSKGYPPAARRPIGRPSPWYCRKVTTLW